MITSIVAKHFVILTVCSDVDGIGYGVIYFQVGCAGKDLHSISELRCGHGEQGERSLHVTSGCLLSDHRLSVPGPLQPWDGVRNQRAVERNGGRGAGKFKNNLLDRGVDGDGYVTENCSGGGKKMNTIMLQIHIQLSTPKESHQQQHNNKQHNNNTNNNKQQNNNKRHNI